MKKSITLGLVVLLMCLGLMAETYRHEGAGISIWFPDNWKVSSDGDALNAEAPGEDAFAHLMALKNVSDLDEAVNAYTKELDKIVTDFKVTTDGEEAELNGLKFFILEGTGKVEGAKVELGIALIVTPKTIVILITVNTPESNQKYGKDFEKIIQSIQTI